MKDNCLVWGPTGGHVHPPWTKILTMVFEGHMCLEYEMGCYHRSFRGKPVFFTGYPEVGESTLYSSGRNNVLFLSLYNHIYLVNEQRYWYAVFCKCFLWCLLLTCMTKLPLPVTGNGKNWAILHVFCKILSIFRYTGQKRLRDEKLSWPDCCNFAPSILLSLGK